MPMRNADLRGQPPMVPPFPKGGIRKGDFRTAKWPVNPCPIRPPAIVARYRSSRPFQGRDSRERVCSAFLGLGGSTQSHPDAVGRRRSLGVAVAALSFGHCDLVLGYCLFLVSWNLEFT